MSNPEKRDDRSMSDILASIRKIMAQEPAVAAPPSNTRAPLNGVSGPREPELKLPPHPAETAAANPAPATEPVSLDELLAETPHAAAPAGPAPKPAPAAKAASTSSSPASNSLANGAPEWLFPRQNASDAAKESVAEAVLPAPTKDAAPAAKVGSETPSASPAAKLGGQSAGPAPALTAATIGPPTPKLGDLGSVVPGKAESADPQPEAGPQRPATAERTVLGPPLPGPLLGEPPRVPAASEALPEVPGADALRRLIAGVIPPSAHPSVAPAAKAPDAAPASAPTADRADDAAKVDATAKAASDAKVEAKLAPANPPPAAKKVEAPAPTPTPASSPAPKPATAAPAPTPAPAPASKPAATPAPAAKSAAPVPAQAVPAPKPAATAPVVGKTMDETVVELLRPLLRDWLNANMPRLIEPALKAELEALRTAAAKDKKD